MISTRVEKKSIPVTQYYSRIRTGFQDHESDINDHSFTSILQTNIFEMVIMNQIKGFRVNLAVGVGSIM